MSERSELEQRAAALVEELGEDPVPTRLSNAKLAERVEELETRKVERDAVLRQEAIIEEHHAAFVERLVRAADPQDGRGMRYAFEVAPGKQLQCRYGLLRSGCQVKREWVGGIDALDDLVKAGSVLCGPRAKRFEVAEGRRLENTTRGTLEPGARVEPEYVGGMARLEVFLREGAAKRNQIPEER